MGRQALAKPWAAEHRLGIVLLRRAGQWQSEAEQVRATAMPRLGQQRGGFETHSTAVAKRSGAVHGSGKEMLRNAQAKTGCALLGHGVATQSMALATRCGARHSHAKAS